MRISDWSSDVCSSDLTDPRPALAYHLIEGTGPTVIFLPGYASDMAGSKAPALEAWAKARGQAFLRFDYAGCGRSEGAFADQTLAGWRDDALTMIDWAVTGPVVLVGSSMGGWRSEEHTSELQSLMRISYAVFCLKKKNAQHKTMKITLDDTS